LDSPTKSNHDDSNNMVASSINTIKDACPEYTEDTSDAEYPKSIPEDIDKYIADAASVRKVISKPCDSLDLLVVSGIA
jgi:hypothetical protein